MTTPSLLVRDLDLVHSVMSRHFSSFERNDFFVNSERDALLSENPFIKTGDAWKEGRALVSPFLTISRVKAMFPGVKNACDKMSLYVSTFAEKEFEAMEVGRDWARVRRKYQMMMSIVSSLSALPQVRRGECGCLRLRSRRWKL